MSIRLSTGKRQSLLPLAFEVEGVEDGDVPDDAPGRVDVQLRELVLLAPAEARTTHLVAQAGLQKVLQTAVVRVRVADGHVADQVRIFADLLESLGDARRAVEQQVLVVFAPADEEARVGSLGLALEGGEAGTGTENVDLHESSLVIRS